MTLLQLDFDAAKAPTVLCLGAHADDLEIGAGATLVSLARLYPQANLIWAVLSADEIRGEEARASANHCLSSVESAVIQVQNFKDGHFPAQLPEIKKYFESLKEQWNPDLIFTHFREDLHQDHRAVAEVTWQTFRNHTILEYEIPKFDGDLKQPNVYCPVRESLRHEKLDIIERYFQSQSGRSWFTRDTFSALMRIRGIECNSPSGYAEAFHARKLRLGLADG